MIQELLIKADRWRGVSGRKDGLLLSVTLPGEQVLKVEMPTAEAMKLAAAIVNQAVASTIRNPINQVIRQADGGGIDPGADGIGLTPEERIERLLRSLIAPEIFTIIPDLPRDGGAHNGNNADATAEGITHDTRHGGHGSPATGEDKTK